MDLQNNHPKKAIQKKQIVRKIKKILSDLESEIDSPLVTEVSIVFTTDSDIQALNKNYRAKDKPTDVLSFSLLEGAPVPTQSLGDVVISLDTAERQAKVLGVPLDDELLRLLIHGLLHLIGYDHENVPKEEANRMKAREDELFNLIA
ncbi:MAG: rRNA maturation RNase YbeY [Bdellovibrionales bacterium]|nr:rRNA maturation RNase YbeY [Bdellovibrionales bacterium]